MPRQLSIVCCLWSLFFLISPMPPTFGQAQDSLFLQNGTLLLGQVNKIANDSVYFQIDLLNTGQVKDECIAQKQLLKIHFSNGLIQQFNVEPQQAASRPTFATEQEAKIYYRSNVLNIGSLTSEEKLAYGLVADQAIKVHKSRSNDFLVHLTLFVILSTVLLIFLFPLGLLLMIAGTKGMKKSWRDLALKNIDPQLSQDPLFVIAYLHAMEKKFWKVYKRCLAFFLLIIFFPYLLFFLLY